MIKNAFILNFFKLYNMLWKLALPFLRKNRRLQLGFEKRITCFHLTKADIWIQAASAGEAYLAVNILKKLSPGKQIKILVTSTTSQGIDILKTRLTKDQINKSIDLKIEYFPFDMPDIIEKAVKAITPCIMVLLETEVWPALLLYLKLNRTRIYIINARLSKKSFNLYLKTRFLWKHLAPDRILATSKRDKKRYGLIFKQAEVDTMPNIKFESIDTDHPTSGRRQQMKNVLPKTLPLTLLASVRRQEEKQGVLIIKTLLKRFPNQVVAVFPRHMHRISAWKKQLSSQNLHFHLRSGITTPLTFPGIILWDRFGELNTAYGFAKAVFVGGSLKPLGGQNFIEPAGQGAVIVTGPYYDDFAWVGDDVFKKGIVKKVSHWKAVANTLLETLETPVNRPDRIQAAKNFIQLNQGGTQKACDEILKAFDSIL